MFISSSSFGQDSNGYISTRGTGQMNCGEYMGYVNIGNQGQIELFTQWIWGYMVSYQMRGSYGTRYLKTTQGNIMTPDKGTVELFMKKFCNDHPLGTIIEGTNELIRQSGGLIVGGKK